MVKEVVGATFDEQGTLICENCKGKNWSDYMHTDGATEYSCTYRCAHCNSLARVTCERSKEDLDWWGEEM